jgi:transcriptional regulator GlxA family with amidase domain
MHPMVLAQLEDLVLLSLLTHHRHNHSESIRVHSEVPAPRAVRRAMDLCDQGGHSTVTVTGLAEAAGISVRALQEGFRRYVGMTPTEYLRESRLRHVRAELLDGPTAEARTVADIAYRWGFTHLGRFAHDYRVRYGELPSETFSHNGAGRSRTSA